jgi:hypothetical protein
MAAPNMAQLAFTVWPPTSTVPLNSDAGVISVAVPAALTV